MYRVLYVCAGVSGGAWALMVYAYRQARTGGFAHLVILVLLVHVAPPPDVQLARVEN